MFLREIEFYGLAQMFLRAVLLAFNVLGAEAVSEFTAKSLFKERKRSFSPKALFEVQKRLLPLPLVIGGRLANVNFYCPFAVSFWLCHPAETFGP